MNNLGTKPIDDNHDNDNGSGLYDATIISDVDFTVPSCISDEEEEESAFESLVTETSRKSSSLFVNNFQTLSETSFRDEENQALVLNGDQNIINRKLLYAIGEAKAVAAKAMLKAEAAEARTLSPTCCILRDAVMCLTLIITVITGIFALMLFLDGSIQCFGRNDYGECNVNGLEIAGAPHSIIFRNALDNNLCLDVDQSQYVNGTKVRLYTCNNSTAQKWKVNSKREITIGNNYEYCLSGGTGGVYTDSFIWKCNDEESHIWMQLGNIGSTGRIKNQLYKKNIGVKTGCDGVASGRTVELQNDLIRGDCYIQQQWKLEAW
mmetsp:Transcript_6002/g.6550  ORF Transcript_6002/g.6550 Transcript_6002/m.6550 type:complete len:321 (-) Transcript_6002:274-1236(-)